MNITKEERIIIDEFIKSHFDRIIDWTVGDIKKCCRMNPDGTCDNHGALVGAFILWTCAIEYFGGLYTGFTSQGATKARFKDFIEKYMNRYDFGNIEDLRWSLQHYYSPHHFVLYHENNFEANKDLHLSQTPRGILLHLGWAIKDLEEAVINYYQELKVSDNLKIKLWKYYKEQLPIMPVKVETLIKPATFSSLTTGTTIHSVAASGTVSPDEWLKS